MENVGNKMFHYGRTTFVFSPHLESHFVKLVLPKEPLKGHMEKVYAREYLSREEYNYLAKLFKKWDPNYVKSMFDNIQMMTSLIYLETKAYTIL